MAVRQEGRTLLGPEPTLRAIEEFWEGIMCRDAREREELEEWLERQQPPPARMEDGARDAALFHVTKTLKKGVAPGLDGWTSEVLRMLPREAIPALRFLFDSCAAWKCWPQDNLVIRTHMLAKELDQGTLIPSPADWRPIALTSLWMRIWSRWQLTLIPENLLNTFSDTLTGGLPGRSPRGSMLRYLLSLEERMLEPQGDATWLSISVDASKCFDRVHQAQVLQLAKLQGFDMSMLVGVGAYLRSLTRVFSCGQFMGERAITPTNGLFAGRRSLGPIMLRVCPILG